MELLDLSRETNGGLLSRFQTAIMGMGRMANGDGGDATALNLEYESAYQELTRRMGKSPAPAPTPMISDTPPKGCSIECPNCYTRVEVQFGKSWCVCSTSTRCSCCSQYWWPGDAGAVSGVDHPSPAPAP